MKQVFTTNDVNYFEWPQLGKVYARIVLTQRKSHQFCKTK